MQLLLLKEGSSVNNVTVEVMTVAGSAVGKAHQASSLLSQFRCMYSMYHMVCCKVLHIKGLPRSLSIKPIHWKILMFVFTFHFIWHLRIFK